MDLTCHMHNRRHLEVAFDGGRQSMRPPKLVERRNLSGLRECAVLRVSSARPHIDRVWRRRRQHSGDGGGSGNRPQRRSPCTIRANTILRHSTTYYALQNSPAAPAANLQTCITSHARKCNRRRRWRTQQAVTLPPQARRMPWQRHRTLRPPPT